ncbi:MULTISPECIES: hypothetical protein [Bradyrhizobium]|uniref:hypothetical protein n=1 Tax=Bradyrhizobium TaxID=374 RepID=UPI001EDA9050|nr:hypothetical protein [Bradyrhizobium zhengyangense]MCG2645710.1 hypothetical protein [Bradyrhizobium zhengyangense]
MTAEIVQFKPKLKPPTPGEASFTVTVDGADYRVEKRFDPNTGCGFGKIADDSGRLLMMFPTKLYPDHFVARMIMCWRNGYSVGRREGLPANLKVDAT